MRRIGKLTAQILAQNAGRDPDRLRLKLEHLRQDPFAFFRGTNPLFLGFLPRGHALFRAPRTLVCGDLHLENFGAYKGENRLSYFDISDFDEACAAPFTLDLVRFVAGVRTAAGPLGLSHGDATRLIRCFLDAYVRCIAEGKPRWIERSLAQGPLRAVLRRSMKRTRRELLDRITRLKGGRRRIRIDGVRAMSVDARERRLLREFLAHERARWPIPRRERGFFDLLDAARRVAGCGSLGLPRYLLLIRGRGGPNQHFLLDLKFAAPSAASRWLRRAQPAWTDDAARVVSIQRILQAVPPAMLAAARFGRRPFVVKELQPSIDRLDIAGMRRKQRRLRQAVEAMGQVAAWAHLRGCGRHGTEPPETLQSFVAAGRWRASLERVAEGAAARTLRAWQTYCRDYDSGVLAAAGTGSAT